MLTSNAPTSCGGFATGGMFPGPPPPTPALPPTPLADPDSSLLLAPQLKGLDRELELEPELQASKLDVTVTVGTVPFKRFRKSCAEPTVISGTAWSGISQANRSGSPLYWIEMCAST